MFTCCLLSSSNVPTNGGNSILLDLPKVISALVKSEILKVARSQNLFLASKCWLFCASLIDTARCEKKQNESDITRFLVTFDSELISLDAKDLETRKVNFGLVLLF